MKYDETKYKVWTWKNPIMLHWIINPGVAFNEIVLGQRIPKVMLEERNSDKSLVENQLVPCPHCNTLHSGLKWSEQNKTAFGNWFGYYCDNCGKIIPCLTNLTSYVILGLTFPIWFWFKDSWKAKWLEKQKVKFSKPLDLTYTEQKTQWLLMGLLFGFFMYVLFAIIFPLIDGTGITQRGLLILLPICVAGGLVFGFAMKVIIGKKK